MTFKKLDSKINMSNPVHTRVLLIESNINKDGGVREELDRIILRAAIGIRDALQGQVFDMGRAIAALDALRHAQTMLSDSLTLPTLK